MINLGSQFDTPRDRVCPSNLPVGLRWGISLIADHWGWGRTLTIVSGSIPGHDGSGYRRKVTEAATGSKPVSNALL